jgi:hypothetical protein
MFEIVGSGWIESIEVEDEALDGDSVFLLPLSHLAFEFIFIFAGVFFSCSGAETWVAWMMSLRVLLYWMVLVVSSSGTLGASGSCSRRMVGWVE